MKSFCIPSVVRVPYFGKQYLKVFLNHLVWIFITPVLIYSTTGFQHCSICLEDCFYEFCISHMQYYKPFTKFHPSGSLSFKAYNSLGLKGLNPSICSIMYTLLHDIPSSLEVLLTDLEWLQIKACTTICKFSSDITDLGLPFLVKSATVPVCSNLLLRLRITCLLGGKTPGNLSMKAAITCWEFQLVSHHFCNRKTLCSFDNFLFTTVSRW